MTATWKEIAHKDFADAVRSKMVWGIIGVFVLFMVVLLLIAGATFPEEVEVDAEMALAFVAELGMLFVPLIALITGYMSIVGERRSGSLRVLLSYPFSRFDVVMGKLVGRTLVIGTALLVALVISMAVAAGIYGAPDLGLIVGLIAFVMLFGLAFTGLAVGVSAATETRGKAMAAVLGIYLLFLMFWDALVGGIYYLVNGSLPGLKAEGWYFLLGRLSPIEAFRTLADRIFEQTIYKPVMIPIEDIPADTTPEQLELSNRVIGEMPFYLGDWSAAVVLIAWGVVPAVVGYLRFRDADLG